MEQVARAALLLGAWAAAATVLWAAGTWIAGLRQGARLDRRDS